MDLKIKTETEEFHGRTCGIIKQENKFLIMRVNKTSYFHIPGGHIEIGEDSKEAVIREIKEEIGIEFIQEEGKFLGTIQKENYFRDVWKFKRDISSKDIFYNDGEVIDSKWVLLDEYVDLYNNGEIAPSGDFIIKMLKEKELEEER